jgi:hypothetical protein
LTGAARSVGQVGPPPEEPGTGPALSARAPAPRQPLPPQGAADSAGAGAACGVWAGGTRAAVTRGVIRVRVEILGSRMIITD